MTVSGAVEAIPTWDLADRLNKSLRHADVSVQQMADFLEVHRNTISAWLHGRGKGPARAMLVSWAVATGVDYEWLAHGDEGEPEGDGPNPANSSDGAGWRPASLRLPHISRSGEPVGYPNLLDLAAAVA